MRCPTKDDALAAVLALLPRGRAWQSHDSGPEPHHDAVFDPAVFDPAVFDTESREGSTLYRFWEAVANVLTFANQRLCALINEMFCATQVETRPEWMTEFGLPDACDPFPDLCTKVAAIGGSRCEYFAAIAARAGWSIDCIDTAVACGGQMGCSQIGTSARYGGQQATLLQLIVYTAESPAFVGQMQTPPVFGRLQMGMPITCAQNFDSLRCLMDRVAPAHVEIQYHAA